MERNLKKQLLITAAVIVSLLLILLILIGSLQRCSDSLEEEPIRTDEYGDSVTIEFSTEYVTDEADILLDEVYQGYNLNVYYLDQQNGVGVEVNEMTAGLYGSAVELLYKLVQTMMSGDAEAYNTFFSKLYFESNEPQGAFSMQKLYDIEITKVEEYKSEKGNYTEYIYALDYKIRRNNGSLRPDIDSDGSRTQFILITDREDALLIDRILIP